MKNEAKTLYLGEDRQMKTDKKTAKKREAKWGVYRERGGFTLKIRSDSDNLRKKRRV